MFQLRRERLSAHTAAKKYPVGDSAHPLPRGKGTPNG